MFIRECLAFSWRILRWRFAALLWLALVLSVMELVACFVLIVSLRELGGFLCHLTAYALWGGYLNAARVAAEGRKPRLSDALQPLTTTGARTCLAGACVLAGSLACGIGVALTSTLFLFVPLYLNDGASTWEALGSSKDLALNRPGAILALNVSLALLNVVGGALFLVGLLVTMPLSALAVVRAYQLVSASASRARRPAPFRSAATLVRG